MTSIKSDSPVIRETGAAYRGRPLIVELHPGYLTLREKGRRDIVSIDYATAYELGWKMKARNES
jgi:hypothetical protein